MSSSSDESSSSGAESNLDVNVKSVLETIKAAMKSTLRVIMVVVHHCDEETRTQIEGILNRYKRMCNTTELVNSTRKAYFEDWERIGPHVLQIFTKLEDAYKTVENNMSKLQTVKHVYGQMETQEMLRAKCSKIIKAKNAARSKAGKEKSHVLHRWHVSLKAARNKLGITGNTFPKKGTPLYTECKRLMAETN